MLITEFRNAGKHGYGAGDGSKRVANFMGDGGGEPADRSQTILHADFALETANLGEIVESVNVAHGFVFTRVQGCDSYAEGLAKRIYRVVSHLGMGLRLRRGKRVSEEFINWAAQQLTGSAIQKL